MCFSFWTNPSLQQYQHRKATIIARSRSHAWGGQSPLCQDTQDTQNTDQNLLTQAQNLRSGISGVSLDEEATQLVTYQRGYEAIAKMVTVLDDLTETVIQMITPT